MNATRTWILCWAVALVCLCRPATEALAENPASPESSAVEASPPAPPSDKVPPSPLEGALKHVEQLSLEELWRHDTSDTWFFVGCVVVAVVLGRIGGLLLGRLSNAFQRRGWIGWSQSALDLIGPARLTLLTVGLSIGLYHMTATPPRSWVKILQLLYSVAGFWYVFNLVSVIEALMRRLAARSGTGLEQLIPLIRKMLRIVVVALATLFLLNNVFEQNIGAWLAGLGIAGLAVSLAAQDSLKNLFGSVTILLDRPFKIGERIIFGGNDGVVEEIGFRSTKLRTLTGNLLTIPNSSIVNEAVENVDRRRSIRRVMKVTITYDTPVAKIRQAVEILRRILEEDGIREPIHPVIGRDAFPPRVHFQDFDATSLILFVIYWYAPPAWWDYMDHAQRLNLRIFEEFEKAGIDFAYSTQTVYLTGDEKRRLAMNLLGKDLDRPA